MTIEEQARQILNKSGTKQSWVVEQMNTYDPDLKMTATKLSATLKNQREMTVPEFLAFCHVTNTEPNAFSVA